jgi:hypothetical protein
MLNKLSLKTKAIIAGIAIGTVPMLSMGAMVYSAADNHITAQANQAQQDRAQGLSDKINRFLFERYGDIQVLAKLPIIADASISNKVTTEQKQLTLNNMVRIYGVYDSVAVFDLNGNVLVQSSGATVPNHKDQDSFKKALQTGQPVMTNAEKSPATGEMVMYFAAPIKEATTGKNIGVVKSRMPLKYVEALAKDFEKNGEEWHLVDNASGKFFSALEKEQVGREAQADFGGLDAIVATKKPGSLITIDKIDGAQQLISYTPFEKLEGLPQLNWSTVLASDTTNTFSTQRLILMVLLFGTGGTALIVGAIAILLASRTTNLIKGISNAIASSSTEIAATVEQQERTISQQAVSVNQTTTTMDELGASSRQAAEQAEASASGARQALVLAEDGTRTVHQTMEGMATLKDKVGAIAEQIMRLSEQTTQIGGISGLVGDLANQTNMLALNAAVEAARAGEHGKGFGVVAAEIRKLADQSKKSSDKINALVGDIQAAINSTVMATDEGTKTVDTSINLAEGTVATFSGVADAVNSVFVNSQQISMSAKQQAIAVQQVVASMNALNLGAKETASGIAEVRGSTQQLHEAAQQLQSTV